MPGRRHPHIRPGLIVIGGKLLVYYLVLWLLASAMIGFSEEIIFRGYLLATLASGIGFWAASVLLSIGFGALHDFLKPYERWEDFTSTGLIGVVCFALRRTGSLAFSMFDFSAIFVYSGRNAGEFAIGRLLRTLWPGPQWLTGGLLGPEASRLVFAVIALLFFTFNRIYSQARFP